MGITRTDTRPVIDGYSHTHVSGPFIPTVNESLDDQKIIGQSGATQTTTSYRTSRFLPDDDTVELDTLSSATNWGQVTGNLSDQAMRGPRSTWDTGHPFSTEKRFCANYWHEESVRGADGNTYRYSGAVYPLQLVSGAVGRFYPVSGVDLTPLGTRAIAATVPTRPAASLLTALLEFRNEGLPRGIGASLRRGLTPRAVAEEYLNLTFGIKPLIRDMREVATAIINLDKLMRQYDRDSGKLVRRRFRFPAEVTAVQLPEQSGKLIGPNSNHGGIKLWGNSAGTPINTVFGTQYETILTNRSVWFSGGYVYHAVATGRPRRRWDAWVEGAIHFLGLEASLKTAWDVLPWSWLFDWNANMGDLLVNLDAFQKDDLVLRYGYLMCETVVTHQVHAVKTTSTRWGPSGPFSLNYVTIRKERVRANPYGFSLAPASYSDKQWSILSALGITRAPRTLYS